MARLDRILQSTDPRTLDLLYRVVHAEAAGEGEIGQAAVAHTILNRARSSRFPGSVQGVMMQPGQFSALNEETGYAGGEGATPWVFEADYQVPEATRLAVDRVLAGEIEDPTGGAVNYYNPDVADPAWGSQMGNRVKIGNHLFGSVGAPGEIGPIDMGFVGSQVAGTGPGTGDPLVLPGADGQGNPLSDMMQSQLSDFFDNQLGSPFGSLLGGLFGLGGGGLQTQHLQAGMQSSQAPQLNMVQPTDLAGQFGQRVAMSGFQQRPRLRESAYSELMQYPSLV